MRTLPLWRRGRGENNYLAEVHEVSGGYSEECPPGSWQKGSQKGALSLHDES